MIFVRLWNYLMGYLVIRVDGLSLEKFINLTVANGIYLWKINRVSYTRLNVCIGIKSFKKLLSIRRKVHCRIKILEKRGLPFVLYRYRNRKMLFAGMVVFLIILYTFSAFIWQVEILGTETIDPERVIKELEDLGVKPGTFKGNIDRLSIENRLVINIEELSWVSVKIRGSKAIVKVAEGVLPPKMVDKSIPANIVAAKDGIIDKMIVLEGEAVVDTGDTVRKDQLLVSGVIDHPDTTGTRYVHSMAQIMARVWYEEKVSISLNEPIKERTGNKYEVKYMELADVDFKFRKKEIPFEKYEMEVKKEPLFLESRFLPAYFIVEEYYEIKETEPSENMDFVQKKAEEIALDRIRGGMPKGAKIVDKKLKCDIIEGEEVIVVLTVEALENIAVQKEIIIQ